MEKILDSRMFRQKLQYLIKWKGYGVKHNSWEYKDNIHVDKKIVEFHTENPGAPRHIRSINFDSIPFWPILTSTNTSRWCFFEGGVIVRGTPQLRLPTSTPHHPHIFLIQLFCQTHHTFHHIVIVYRFPPQLHLHLWLWLRIDLFLYYCIPFHFTSFHSIPSSPHHFYYLF